MSYSIAIPSAASLRLLWSVVEETPTQNLLNLDSQTLIQQLMQRLSQRVCFHTNEQACLQTYLSNRVTLIRDQAESRIG